MLIVHISSGLFFVIGMIGVFTIATDENTPSMPEYYSTMSARTTGVTMVGMALFGLIPCVIMEVLVKH